MQATAKSRLLSAACGSALPLIPTGQAIERGSDQGGHVTNETSGPLQLDGRTDWVAIALVVHPQDQSVRFILPATHNTFPLPSPPSFHFHPPPSLSLHPSQLSAKSDTHAFRQSRKTTPQTLRESDIHLNLLLARRTTSPHDPHRPRLFIPAYRHISSPFAQLLDPQDPTHLWV